MSRIAYGSGPSRSNLCRSIIGRILTETLPRFVHLTQPKSGSQWVRDVLTSPEIAAYSGVRRSFNSFDVQNLDHLQVPAGEFGGPIFNLNRWEWTAWKRPLDKAVVVLRDPRDLLVSLVFSAVYSHGATDGVMKNVVALREQMLALSMEQRLLQTMTYVEGMARWYVSWTEQSTSIDAAVVRYEDLVSADVATFTNLISSFGWPVPHEAIASAVRRLSFTERSGRQNGEEDVFSHLRKGISGDWKNHFTERVAEQFENAMPGLLKTTGYESDSSWWRDQPKSGQREQASANKRADRMVDIVNARNEFLERELVEKEVLIQNFASQGKLAVQVDTDPLRNLTNSVAAMLRSQGRIEAAMAGSDLDTQQVSDLYFLGWQKQDFVDAIIEKERVIRDLSAVLSAYRAMLAPLALGRRAKSKLRGLVQPKLGRLQHHPPRQQRRIVALNRTADGPLPSIGIVTPSYQQGRYIRETIESVLSQSYAPLQYFVQDGGSTDETTDVLRSFEGSILGWESAKDSGQGAAINLGFAHIDTEIMAYINSDDVLLPGALAVVGEFFNKHPDVDVVYGDRLIIDELGKEIGAWRLPRHDSEVLSWADYIPQETLFWRTSAWKRAGGYIDEKFRFALDWDLLLRLRDSGSKFWHLPRFLGAFRVHVQSKTSQQVLTIGRQEMDVLRERSLGFVPTDRQIQRAIRRFLRAHLSVELVQGILDVLLHRR
jgi:hypothetical protein